MRTYHLGELAVKPGFEDLSMEELGAITAAWRAMWFTGRIRYEDVPAPSSLARRLVEGGWLIDTGNGYDLPEVEGSAREMARVRLRRFRARNAPVSSPSPSGSRNANVSSEARNANVSPPSLFPPHPLSLSQENTPSLVLSSSREINQKTNTGATPSLTPHSHPPIIPPPSPLALSRRGGNGSVEEGVEAVTDQSERKNGPESLYDIMARMAKDSPAIDKWFQTQLAWRRANGGKNVFERDRPAPVERKPCRRYAPYQPDPASRTVSAPSAKPSVSQPEPRLDIRLTREQWEAWRRFEDASPRPEEWRELQEAWLGRGLLFPPTSGQRELLWRILDARPTDTARWVSEAPSRQADEVVGYVLERWREVLRGVEAAA